MIFFRKPVPTFRDHALEHFAAATAALDQPGGGRAGYGRADPDLQILRAITGMAPAGRQPRRYAFNLAPPGPARARDGSIRRRCL